MTSIRCYQDKYPPTEVLKKMYEWSSYHFDRTLVEQFIRCVGIHPVGTLVRLESGLIGVVLQKGEKSLLQPVVRIVYNTRNGGFVRLPYEIDLAKSSGKNGEDRIVQLRITGKARHQAGDISLTLNLLPFPSIRA